MSEAVQVALIASLPGTLMALAALLASIRNGNKIEGVKHAMNSILDDRVVAEGQRAGAVGREEGRITGRKEAQEDASSTKKDG